MSIPGSASPLFLATAAAAAAPVAAQQIDRSLRFNPSDSPYLFFNPSQHGNRKTFTFSFWVKRSGFGTQQLIHYVRSGAGNTGYIQFDTSDRLSVVSEISGSNDCEKVTTQVFRDPSAWYHIVVKFDAANTNCDIYVNGEEVTAFDTNNEPSNVDSYFGGDFLHYLGAYDGSAVVDGYFAEVHMVNGQALDASDFGQEDSNGVWEPKAFSGASHGTNGFYLKFADNSSNAALGTDSSGNNNTWTVYNLSATETTTPTVTVVGDPTSSTDNPFGSGNGYSVDFDGNDELRFTGPGTVTGDLTVECFYKMTQSDGFDRIFSTKEDSYGSEQTIIRRHDNGNLQFYFGNGTPEQQSSTIGSGWRHAAIVYDRSASTVTYYDHGSRVGTDSYSSDVPITLMVVAGGYGSENFNGKVSNARLTKQALYSGASYTVPSSTLTTTSQGATASNVALLCCHKSSTTAVEGGNPNSKGLDSLLDTPTNYSADSGNNAGNYATLNPLSKGSNATLSNGNLDLSCGSSSPRLAFSTIGMTSGKYYCEYTFDSGSATNGLSGPSLTQTGYVGSAADQWGYYHSNGQVYNNNSASSYGATYSTGDIIGIAFDADNGTLTFYKNGTSQGTAATGLTSGPYFFAFGEVNYNGSVNFGQRPFAYTPPTGYVSLCAENLSESAYASIPDGSKAMDIKTYSGTGSTQSITGLGFSPDLVWLKCTNASKTHRLYDAVRGATKVLQPDIVDAEATDSAGLTSFNSDGFTLGGSGGHNGSTDEMISWAWDAGTSTASNTDGSITSNVRVSQANGFSIVTYSATGSTATIGHGLNAAPGFIIVKSRTNADGWPVYHQSLDNTANNYLTLHVGNSVGSINNYWDGTNSSVIGTLGGYAHSTSGEDYLALCWTPIEGFSSFGSYEGNGSADGPFVYTGHRARFLIIKCSTKSGEDWVMLDTARDTYNDGDSSALYASLAHANNSTSTLITTDILSNGFKVRATNAAVNQSGETYVYMSFASHPFRTARAR